MDEMLRNKALIQQILSRANSISETMTKVDRRLSVLNERMDLQQRPKDAEIPPMRLMDLHSSVLSQVVARIDQAAAVCALSRACRSMRDLAAEYDWQALCRAHWGITQSDASRVRRMDADLIHGYAKIDKATDSSVVWEQRQRGNPWRNIYRDRIYGWKIVIKMLQWLRMHCHPPNVAGVSHRFQLYLALSYMDMCTCTTEEEARRAEILKMDGIASLIGLLNNSHPIFRSQAAAVLGNIMFERPDVQDQVLVATFQGKKLSDRLETQPTSQTQHMSRALVNMWVQPPVPQVVLYNDEAEVALPKLRSGLWQLQEYSLRGDTFERIDVVLSFSEDGSLCGGGSEIIGDEPEDFIVEGVIGNDHKWEFSKVFTNQHKIVFKGFSDLHGAYGVYYPVRGWDSSFGNMASPKVFRLFRDSDSEVLVPGPDGSPVASKPSAVETVDDVIELVQEMWAAGPSSSSTMNASMQPRTSPVQRRSFPAAAPAAPASAASAAADQPGVDASAANKDAAYSHDAEASAPMSTRVILPENSDAGGTPGRIVPEESNADDGQGGGGGNDDDDGPSGNEALKEGTFLNAVLPETPCCSEAAVPVDCQSPVLPQLENGIEGSDNYGKHTDAPLSLEDATSTPSTDEYQQENRRSSDDPAALFQLTSPTSDSWLDDIMEDLLSEIVDIPLTP